jgi:hypothetical protein
MRSSLMVLFLALVIGLSAVMSAASGGSIQGKHCPQCDHSVCHAVPETTKQEKHCWQVECKEICIPAIKWPWSPCCEPPRCGKVKMVKVLKKVEYECERCGYRWEIQCSPCRRGE